MPALTLSWISARSNSAIAPIIWNISRPEGVEKSRLSRRLTKSTPNVSQFGQGINKIGERSTEPIELPNQNYFETTSVRIDEQSVKLKASVRGTRNADVKGN
jgi:hypothetical protein